MVWLKRNDQAPGATEFALVDSVEKKVPSVARRVRQLAWNILQVLLALALIALASGKPDLFQVMKSSHDSVARAPIEKQNRRPPNPPALW